MPEPPKRDQLAGVWTVETLRQMMLHLLDEKFEFLRQVMAEADRRYEERFAAQEKNVAAALGASDRAVTKAEIATEKRFEGVNEFRAALSDQASRFMSRVEVEQMVRSLAEKTEAHYASTSDRVTRLEQDRAAGLGAERKGESTFQRAAVLAGVVVSVVMAAAAVAGTFLVRGH